MTLTPYINLSGNAEEAMNFYKNIFGGEIEIIRWSEMPPNPKMPVSSDWQGKVMHGSLSINEKITIYLSDSVMDEKKAINNSVYLHVTFDSEEKAREAFTALSEDGTVNMPIDKTFWGSVYGDLIDRYGTGWQLEFVLSE